MLFKQKLLLSNCDSVRGLDSQELQKRILSALVFADGIILTPNMLVDNSAIDLVLDSWAVKKYLREEGAYKLVVRGLSVESGFNLTNYFEHLPETYIVSSIEGTPRLGDLTTQQRDSIRYRLDKRNALFSDVAIDYQNLSEMKPSSLTDEIFKRIADDATLGNYFDSDGDRFLFKEQAANINGSRSEWYGLAEKSFGDQSELDYQRFKLEVIDPSYNYLFAREGEGFLQDNIRHLQGVPKKLLHAGVTIRALKNEVELIKDVWSGYKLILTMGASGVVEVLTDSAKDYIQDKLVSKSLETDLLSKVTKNWLGLYPKMTRYLGVEFKP